MTAIQPTPLLMLGPGELPRGAFPCATDAIAAFCQQQSAAPSRPYERLFPIDRWSDETRSLAEAVLRGEWHDMHFPPLAIRPPVNWKELGAPNRAQQFRAHSWDPLGPLLAGYDATREEKYLASALGLAVDWVRQHPSLETESDFAWYDMATGLRAYRLAYLLDQATRANSVENPDLSLLIGSAMLHATALADDSRFAAHSNHGFYVAAGQLALARRLPGLPGRDAAETQARQRLQRLIDDQFTHEGVHREHSPEYHLRVFEAFQGLLTAGLFEDDWLQALSNRIQEALAWFVLPDGTLAMFGDTTSIRINNLEPITNEALKFAATTGREGEPPNASMRAFPESGYVVMRDAWTGPDGDRTGQSYLAQTCAFHSRVHKHADDLSVIWYDRGHELLIDPGKYGYLGRTDPDSDLARAGFWYSDPLRIYVESTRAHNTVEIDGRSYPRRDIEPFGSALRRVGETDGVMFAESEVVHFETIQHVRMLVFRPGEWLIVFDWLEDSERQPHRFDQHLHFAPELSLLPGAVSARFAVPGIEVPLQVTALLASPPCAMNSGEHDPMLGWISRRESVIEPCWTATYTVSDAPRATFATLLTFGGDPITTTSPDWTASKVTVNGRKAILRWQQSGRVQTVQLARPENGPCETSYRFIAARS